MIRALPALALLPVLTACIADNGGAGGGTGRVGMANPASVHCVEQGGKVEIRKGPDGQTGYCHLPDGRVVEEWVLFRASHPAKP